jgi:hypothetical protein
MKTKKRTTFHLFTPIIAGDYSKSKKWAQYFGPVEIKDNPTPLNDFYVQCTHFFFSFK